MFTGLITGVGKVVALDNKRIKLKPCKLFEGSGLETGESISVSGVCLTLVAFDEECLEFDLAEETIQRTTLGGAVLGEHYNLERALTFSDKLGGHIIQGHVDTTARIVSMNKLEGSTEFEFEVDESWDKYLIDKGSVSVDGVSLTVIKPNEGRFFVAIIPHTWDSTTFQDYQPDGEVNVEFDMIAKHLEKLTQAYQN